MYPHPKTGISSYASSEQNLWLCFPPHQFMTRFCNPWPFSDPTITRHTRRSSSLNLSWALSPPQHPLPAPRHRGSCLCRSTLTGKASREFKAAALRCLSCGLHAIPFISQLYVLTARRGREKRLKEKKLYKSGPGEDEYLWWILATKPLRRETPVLIYLWYIREIKTGEATPETGSDREDTWTWCVCATV